MCDNIDQANNPIGVAGRTNYSEWDRKSKELWKETEQEEELEALESKEALGHSRHAFSQAEADEKLKLENAKATKKQLDKHKDREAAGVLTLDQNWLDGELSKQAEKSNPPIVKITRDTFSSQDAQKRVLFLSHLKGPAVVELKSDLSQLESVSMVPSKDPNDPPQQVKVQGIVKLFLSHLSTDITVKCHNVKIITSHVEVSHCSNLNLHIVASKKDTKIATLQVDLSQHVRIEYVGYDPTRDNYVFGSDKNDKVYHAGVSDMTLVVAKREKDLNEVDSKCLVANIDYLRDGAKSEGAATAEEYQFITHVVSGKLVNERLLRLGNQKLVTENELRKELSQKEATEKIYESTHSQAIDGLLTQYQVDDLIKTCEQHKLKGNEAFGTGEYAQAILWYTRAIDESVGLSGTLVDDEENEKKEETNFFKDRSICYANRSACFLKLGHFEKALDDAVFCTEINPEYIKGFFRRGMALHAMKRYEEALPHLVKCLKIEPNNKQVKQAIQFCEVFMAKQQRQRVEGS